MRHHHHYGWRYVRTAQQVVRRVQAAIPASTDRCWARDRSHVQRCRKLWEWLEAKMPPCGQAWRINSRSDRDVRHWRGTSVPMLTVFADSHRLVKVSRARSMEPSGHGVPGVICSDHSMRGLCPHRTPQRARLSILIAIHELVHSVVWSLRVRCSAFAARPRKHELAVSEGRC